MASKKILMIDDETDYTNITKIYLEDAGNYEVHVVNRGSEGYPKAKEVKPDIILLDIAMPDVSGFEVARLIDADQELRGIPILFFTGVYQDFQDSPLLRNRHVLTKPTSGENLMAQIEKILSKPQG